MLCHDLPGLHLRRGEPPAPRGPSPEVVQALDALLRRGIGIVATHHALAGWPAWDGWADALGGRFHYAPGTLHGQPWPSSGTRITSYTARVVAPGAPGLRRARDLALHDELYCCPVLSERLVPLLRHDADTSPTRFTSTYEHVLHGEAAAPDCAGHPPASDLVAWATSAAASPVVYVQPGDSAATFGRPRLPAADRQRRGLGRLPGCRHLGAAAGRVLSRLPALRAPGAAAAGSPEAMPAARARITGS